MRFQVPQFIEVEDKIFGPLTLKQFIYLVGGAGLSFIFYRYLPFYLAVFFILPIAGFSLALAFYKINKKPFINVVEAAFKYTLGNKLYVWRKVARPRTEEERQEKKAEEATLYVPRLSDSKLKDLTWSLDINEHMGPGVKETMGSNQEAK